MKSRLVTIARNDILYLPVVLLNPNASGGALSLSTQTNLEGTIPLSADLATTNALKKTATGPGTGQFYAAESGNAKAVVVDQGLNTPAIPPTNTISADLFEDSYSIQLDNRLLVLRDGQTAGANVDQSFVDDDNIALYNVSTPSNMIEDISNLADPEQSVIQGPRGTRLSLGFKSSTDVLTSTYLFTRLGGEITLGTSSQAYYYIDTNVRITGLTTGYRIDLPLRILKIKNT